MNKPGNSSTAACGKCEDNFAQALTYISRKTIKVMVIQR